MILKTIVGTAGAALIALPLNASAALLTQTITGVNVLGTTYDVNFIQDSANGSTNTYNAIMPAITFTTQADATAAVDGILAVTSLNFDWTPASFSASNGFRVAYGFTANDYNFMTATDEGIHGPFQSGRDTANVLSFAVFTVSTVPVPAAVWLFGSGLLGLVGMARRKA